MEENKLFQEIEPLIEEYIEYSRQEMPDLFFDSRITARMERLNKQYSQDKEGDLLRRLDDEEVGRSVDQRRALIEQLTNVREENMKAKREVIYSKVKEFVDNSIEQMNKEIEEKREQEIERKIKKEIEEKTKELEEAEQKRKESFIAIRKANKVRKILLKEVGNESKIYKLADEEAKEKLEKNKEDVKRSETLKQELQEKNIELQEKEQEIVGMEQDLQYFKYKYDDIDFLSEHGIYTLLDMIGLEKEQEMVRMSDGRVFDGQEEVSDMGMIMDMQEEAKKTPLPEKIDADTIINTELQTKNKLAEFFDEKYLLNNENDKEYDWVEVLSKMQKNKLFNALDKNISRESKKIQNMLAFGEVEKAQKRYEEFKNLDIVEKLKNLFSQRQEEIKVKGEKVTDAEIVELKQMYVTLKNIGITDVNADYLMQLDSLKVEELSNNMQSIKREKIDELLLFFAKNYCGKDIPKDEVALIYAEVRDNELFNDAYLEILAQADLVEGKFQFGYNKFLNEEIENFKNIDVMEMLKEVINFEKKLLDMQGDKATEDDIVKVMRMEETLKKIQKTLNPKKEKGQGTKTVTRTISQNIGQSGNGKKGIKPNEQGQQPIKPNIKIQNIVVDLKNKAVEIKIDGIEVPFVLENLNIEEVMQKGEHVKVQFLDEATFSEKSYIKKSDALILGALKEFGDRLKDAKMDEHKDIYENIDVLNANYMNNFTSSVRNTDSIKYILSNDDKDNYSKKTFKQIKKSAKNAQDLGIAQVEGLKEMSIKDRIMNWFAQIKTKRIGSKTKTQQPQHVLTKKQERENFINKMNKSKQNLVKQAVYKKGPRVKSINKSQDREL